MLRGRRLADDVIVDLMGKGCGVDYDDAAQDQERLEIDDVVIPLASTRTLLRTKSTVRPSHAADTEFLRAAIDAEDRES